MFHFKSIQPHCAYPRVTAMAPRSRRKGVRRQTRAVVTEAPYSDGENDPLAMSSPSRAVSPIKKRQRQPLQPRKSRRIALKLGEPGPSGWTHSDDGDERNLIPPSDDDEYEDWRVQRESSRSRRQSSGSALGVAAVGPRELLGDRLDVSQSVN